MEGDDVTEVYGGRRRRRSKIGAALGAARAAAAREDSDDDDSDDLFPKRAVEVAAQGRRAVFGSVLLPQRVAQTDVSHEENDEEFSEEKDIVLPTTGATADVNEAEQVERPASEMDVESLNSSVEDSLPLDSSAEATMSRKRALEVDAEERDSAGDSGYSRPEDLEEGNEYHPDVLVEDEIFDKTNIGSTVFPPEAIAELAFPEDVIGAMGSRGKSSAPQNDTDSDEDTGASLEAVLVLDERFKFKTFADVFGFIQKTGSMQSSVKSYDEMSRLFSMALGNAELLRPFRHKKLKYQAERRVVGGGHNLKLNKGVPFFPGREKIRVKYPRFLEALTLGVQQFEVQINTMKPGGLRVIRQNNTVGERAKKKRMKVTLEEEGASSSVRDLEAEKEVLASRIVPVATKTAKLGMVSVAQTVGFDFMIGRVWDGILSTMHGAEGHEMNGVSHVPLITARSHVLDTHYRVDAVCPRLTGWDAPGSSSVVPRFDPDSSKNHWEWGYVQIGDALMLILEGKFLDVT